ncbi:MAG: HAD hydrolase-like protein [Candidatus Paceibacterota bacterium]
MNKKVIIFDFDGVIVDTFSFCFKIVDSREYITEADYRRRFDGNVFNAERKYKKPNTTLEDFDRQYAPELMKCEPIKGMREAIQKFAEKYTLVIISSSTTSSIDNFLKAGGLKECFSEVLGCDVDKSKVNKIRRVLKDYKIEPTDAVFITDTLGDIKEGDHCGIKSIAVTWGYSPVDALQKGNPYAIVNDVAELRQKVAGFFSGN